MDQMENQLKGSASPLMRSEVRPVEINKTKARDLRLLFCVFSSEILMSGQVGWLLPGDEASLNFLHP